MTQCFSDPFPFTRQSGLWTGTGTRLLLSPDTLDSVLEISTQGDSDGKLSLAMHWLAKWDHREASSLSPYWMRVEVPKRCPGKILFQQAGKTTPTSGSSNVDVVEDSQLLVPGASIRFHFLANGVQDAFGEDSMLPSEALDVSHLRARSKKLSGPALWFSSTATALKNTSSTQLWGYTIPNEILSFADKNTVPCGVLVLLGILSQDDCPDWYRLYNPNLKAELEREEDEREQEEWEISTFHHEKGKANYGSNFPVALSASSRRRQKRSRVTEKNEDLKISDALTSQAVDSEKMASAALVWLRQEAGLPDVSAKELVEMLLYQMIVDVETALSIGVMLDRWKAWSDGGTITRADLIFVFENKLAFAYAVLMVDTIRGMEETVEGSLAADLQACVKVWPTIRLG